MQVCMDSNPPWQMRACLWAMEQVPLLEVLSESKRKVSWRLVIKGLRFRIQLQLMFIEGLGCTPYVGDLSDFSTG